METIVFEVGSDAHPEVQEVFRMPILPVLWVERLFLLLLLLILKGVVASESVITVLVTETHLTSSSILVPDVPKPIAAPATS
jgi:hypothetical protein